MRFAMYIRRNTEIAGANTDASGPSMTIDQVHDRLAHPGEENTKKNGEGAGMDSNTWQPKAM